MNWSRHNLIQDGNVVRVAAWEKYDWLQQGFTLRKAGNMAYSFGDPDRVITARHAIAPLWTTMQQVHDNHIKVAEKLDDGRGDQNFEDGFPATDGLVSDIPEALLAVVVADCVPLLIVDPTARRVAAVHAGRRGTIAQIAHKAVEAMIQQGSNAKDIQACIGPSIGPCCYEINRETGEHYDLWSTNEQQLREAGVETIIRTDLCTYENNDVFFSARADKVQGRFAGLVGIK